MSDRSDDLARIALGLAAASPIFQRYSPGGVTVETKAGGDPVTRVDREVDQLLQDGPPAARRGWLSGDDPTIRRASTPARLDRRPARRDA
ncbi:MAG: hypothetical protein U0166_25915 [Acidobacteriota bacterium]